MKIEKRWIMLRRICILLCFSLSYIKSWCSSENCYMSGEGLSPERYCCFPEILGIQEPLLSGDWRPPGLPPCCSGECEVLGVELSLSTCLAHQPSYYLQAWILLYFYVIFIFKRECFLLKDYRKLRYIHLFQHVKT